MLALPVLTTVTVGNHLLTAAEQAAGAPQRPPFTDDAGAPVDPDAVAIVLTAPTGETRSYGYPEAGPGDAGVVERQEAGRYFVRVAPAADEDGLWRWSLVGQMELGTGWSDQDCFSVRRPIAPGG